MADLPDAVAADLREIATNAFERRNEALTSSAAGLVSAPPDLKIIRALVWATYTGADRVEAAGAALFNKWWPEARDTWPDGVHVEQAKAHVEWFEKLRLNIPAPEN